MKQNIIFSVFLLLVSAAYAFPVDFEFGAPDACYPDSCRFETDMQLSTDMTLSLTSGDIASGNENNIQSGTIVCSGSTLSAAVSTTNADWSASAGDIVSIYPECDESYCPLMPSASGSASGINIVWLSESVFNEHENFARNSRFATDYSNPSTAALYNDLQTFRNVPVTYVVGSTYPDGAGAYSNKLAGANVFCTGEVEVRDGTTVVGTYALPAAQDIPFEVTGTGSHQITSRITADCIAVVLKHPPNINDHQSRFRMYYYYLSSPPSQLSSGTASTDTITIDIGEMGGTCSISDTGYEVSTDLAVEDLALVTVTMRNNGDQVQVNSVSASNGYTVDPFPTSMCGDLGLPSSVCPDTNGFNSNLNPGASRNLYVLVEPTGSGGTVLTFNAQTTGGTCGGTSTCHDTVDIRGALSCEIDPPSLEHHEDMSAEYEVTCQDLLGGEVPCQGNNWYWSGLSGEFFERTNTYADTYVTSPAGSSGTLNYQSGEAICSSDVDVTDQQTTPPDVPPDVPPDIPPQPPVPHYECEFIPSSAEMNTSDEQYFELNCFRNGEPSTPNSAGYDIIDGLDGETTGGSRNGVTFIAGDNSTGRLRGRAYWNDIPPPHNSAVATAEIEIGDGGGDIPPPTGGNVSLRCEFSPSSAELDTGETQRFNLQCFMDDILSIPDEVFYDVVSGLDGSLTGASTTGVTFIAGENSTGYVTGLAVWDDLIPPNNTAFTFALVIIGDGGNQTIPPEPIPPDIPPGGGGDDPYDGSSEWCTIESIDNVYPGYFGWVSVMCGPAADQQCSNVTWWAQGEVMLNAPQNDYGTYFTVTGDPYEEGFIYAYIDDPGHACYRGFIIQEPECWEFS